MTQECMPSSSEIDTVSPDRFNELSETYSIPAPKEVHFYTLSTMNDILSQSIFPQQCPLLQLPYYVLYQTQLAYSLKQVQTSSHSNYKTYESIRIKTL